MKLIAIHIARVENNRVVFLASKSEVTSFGYLERKPVRELSDFLARQILPKIEVGSRQAITHKGYLSISMRWSDGIAMSAFVDSEYPQRIAFAALVKIHEDFIIKVDSKIWKTVTADNSCGYKDTLKDWLKQFQNPKEFDAVSKTQAKVDATKEIMQQNIEQILGNHQQIEKLLETSEDISTQSEMMFKAAHKANKGCCKMQ